MHTAKIHRRKKGASDLEAYQIVIVGNRRLIYHGNAPHPSLSIVPNSSALLTITIPIFARVESWPLPRNDSTSLFLETGGFAV